MNTQGQIIHARLAQTPNEWVPMPELADISGSWNIHTRIDQLRHESGLHIENKLVRHPINRRRKNSYYRLITREEVKSRKVESQK